MSETIRLPVLLIGLLLCSAAAAEDLVGKMGDVELHSSELKAILDAQPPDARRQLATDAAALERLVRSELMRKAVLNEAKQKGWDKRQELQPLIERARDQVIVSSFVSNVALPGDGYPSEDEIKQFYESNKAQLLAPAQYLLAQIFLPAADGTDKAKAEEAKKRIGELSGKLGKSGADFAKLAKENSAHKESAEKGGELGWVSEEQMVPEIRRAVPGMNKGEVSPPVKSAAGWHLIKLLDRKPAATRPLADIRPSLIGAMRNRKAQDMERSYLEALAIKLPPTINQIEIGKLQSGLR
ncbi:MAG: peptidyl-prolyl cis-trans isomerase [Betaproteobacteria bacterium]|nr:peptidyl-prolyl cis-trans isomerase [Betaproteobacteria bacterium]